MTWCFPLWFSCASSFQESLLRMLLGIEMLQVRLCKKKTTASLPCNGLNKCTMPLSAVCVCSISSTHAQLSFSCFLQTFIINILLEKVPEFMFDRLVISDFFFHLTGFSPFLHLYLYNILFERWLFPIFTAMAMEGSVYLAQSLTS